MPRNKKSEESDTTESSQEPVAELQEESESSDTTENSQETTAPSEENESDYLPKKRVIRRKKSKREKEHPLSAAIRLTVESGKVEFGSRTALKNSAAGKAKLFVFARNTPLKIRDPITKYSVISHTPIIEFDGNTIELGSVCGKPFTISVLAVYDVGASPLLDLVHKPKK